MYSFNSPFKRQFQGGKLSLSSVSEQPSAWPTVTYRCQQTEIKVSPTKNWTLNVLETTEQEQPDCWDMKLSNGSTLHNATVSKTWRGAATLVPRSNSKKQPAPFKHASDFPLTVLHAVRVQHIKTHTLGYSESGGKLNWVSFSPILALIEEHLNIFSIEMLHYQRVIW